MFEYLVATQRDKVAFDDSDYTHTHTDTHTMGMQGQVNCENISRSSGCDRAPLQKLVLWTQTISLP